MSRGNSCRHSDVASQLMAPGRMRDSVTFACGLALVGVLGGCTSNAMEPLNDLDPITIDELVIDPTAIREGGAVVVYAVPEAGQVASPPQANLIQVNVRTSSGESATLQLRPRTCTLSYGTRYICDTFYVGMKPGWHVADIAVHTRRVHGVFSRVLGDGEHASIRILKGDLHAAMRQAASWPGVRFVELGGFFCLANGSGWEMGWKARSPSRSEASAPVTGRYESSRVTRWSSNTVNRTGAASSEASSYANPDTKAHAR